MKIKEHTNLTINKQVDHLRVVGTDKQNIVDGPNLKISIKNLTWKGEVNDTKEEEFLQFANDKNERKKIILKELYMFLNHRGP